MCPKSRSTTPKVIAPPPPPPSVFKSLLKPVQTPIQSPPVFIDESVSINQTFHTYAEPSPESIEPEISANPTPPWSEPVPSNPDPVTVAPNYFKSLMFSPPAPDPEVDNWPEDKEETRMITPCDEYGQHYAWLQHKFPLVHSSDRKYFVHLVLKVQTFLDIEKWLSLSPEQ